MPVPFEPVGELPPPVRPQPLFRVPADDLLDLVVEELGVRQNVGVAVARANEFTRNTGTPSRSASDAGTAVVAAGRPKNVTAAYALLTC